MDFTIKPRLKKSGNYLKASWACSEYGCDLSTKEIADSIIEGDKFSIDLSYNGIHKNLFKGEALVFNLVHSIELIRGGPDTALVKRVLDNGGMINYARKLESQL